MNNEVNDDMSELESAIHHLKEAQQFHDGEEYHHPTQDKAIENVDKALNKLGDYIDNETIRLKENDPFNILNE